MPESLHVLDVYIVIPHHASDKCDRCYTGYAFQILEIKRKNRKTKAKPSFGMNNGN